MDLLNAPRITVMETLEISKEVMEGSVVNLHYSSDF